MILIDFEGEILLDIASLSLSTKAKARTLFRKLADENNWTEDQVRLALERVYQIPTNGYEKGRELPGGLK